MKPTSYGINIKLDADFTIQNNETIKLGLKSNRLSSKERKTLMKECISFNEIDYYEK